VAALGRLPDPLAAEVLQAFAGGRLYAAGDGRVLIDTGAGAIDPASGQALPMPGDAKRIVINNRLRRAIQDALAVSQLFAAEAGQRLAAARRLQEGANESFRPVLEKALQQESSGEVKAALEVALANIDLSSDDPARRRAAVAALGQTGRSSYRPVLQALLAQDERGAYAEPDESVREAARAALRAIDRRAAAVEWSGNLFYGLSLGSVL